MESRLPVGGQVAERDAGSSRNATGWPESTAASTFATSPRTRTNNAKINAACFMGFPRNRGEP